MSVRPLMGSVVDLSSPIFFLKVMHTCRLYLLQKMLVCFICHLFFVFVLCFSFALLNLADFQAVRSVAKVCCVDCGFRTCAFRACVRTFVDESCIIFSLFYETSLSTDSAFAFLSLTDDSLAETFHAHSKPEPLAGSFLALNGCSQRLRAARCASYRPHAMMRNVRRRVLSTNSSSPHHSVAAQSAPLETTMPRHPVAQLRHTLPVDARPHPTALSAPPRLVVVGCMFKKPRHRSHADSSVHRSSQTGDLRGYLVTDGSHRSGVRLHFHSGEVCLLVRRVGNVYFDQNIAEKLLLHLLQNSTSMDKTQNCSQSEFQLSGSFRELFDTSSTIYLYIKIHMFQTTLFERLRAHGGLRGAHHRWLYEGVRRSHTTRAGKLGTVWRSL